MDSPLVCPNISPRERRKRLIAGGVQFGVATVILTVLVATGANRWWRVLLGPIFFGAATGVFQWREKT